MTHKLLLADDSVTIQRVVELTFSGEDVQVVTVGDGEQAIARIPIERPDIVLADIAMPKRSGYDVVAFVKGHPDLAHIPVLLLAGAFEPVDEGRAQQVGCDGVLVKPFEPQQVIARVRELVEAVKAKAPHPVAVPSPVLSMSEPDFASPDFTIQEFEQAEPMVHTPDPPRAEQPLDDYFERLDAAFAGLGEKPESRPIRSAEMDDFRAAEMPTVERLLGATSGHAAPALSSLSGMPLSASAMKSSVLESMPPSNVAAVSGDAVPASGRNPIADIFTALFAVEQGEPGATAVQFQPPRPVAPVVTDEMVDEVTRRVLARLAPDTARDLVRDVVSEIAERLIRDEIARIKTAVAASKNG